jgi:hypothetical protein
VASPKATAAGTGALSSNATMLIAALLSSALVVAMPSPARAGDRRQCKCAVDDLSTPPSPTVVAGVHWHASAPGLTMTSASGWSVPVGVVAPTAAAQRAALVQLYIATNGNAWRSKTGWQDHTTGSDPCDDDWHGVECDSWGGNV